MDNKPAPLHKPHVFSEETMESLRELGMIFREIHERMIAEGYTIIDDQVIKPDGTPYDHN